MKKFIIERDIPGLGKMSAAELAAITRKSNAVLAEMNAPYHWVESYVTGDKMYCVHMAPDEDTVRRHAEKGGFPANRIVEVLTAIDPTTDGR